MDGGGAYGAGKATGQFDPKSYIIKPQVILRLASWLFSIIVFGCISAQGWFEGVCLYNEDSSACRFGTAIGVIAFLGLTTLLVLDALFDNIPSIQQRKYIVLCDLGFSGVWTFFWFVSFCYLTDAWRKTDNLTDVQMSRKSGIEAAIAFSFFSISTFGVLTGLAVMRYRKGVTEDFSSGYEPDVIGAGVGGAGVPQPTPSPYSSYPAAGETGDPYQQAPFSGAPQPPKQPPGDFQPPTY
ncbi:hypothetical protein LSH36_115g06012 [Paralvinella palmiformis]|uniref:MARVEL domain-containing protein n=1 Tax=Paralvinella palmiformis TaxID=53620 RepID=A0AAD9NAY4_9ANNE|nr:hypothetical protein LSH36_115g06012 [Paralvinella palmiformis]